MSHLPLAPTRTWRHVFDEVLKTKAGANRSRWEVALKQKPFDHMRSRVVLETRPEHLLAVLNASTVSTNQYLRRVQNFALDKTWLAVSIQPHIHWQCWQGSVAGFYYQRVTLPVQFWVALGSPAQWQPHIPWWQSFVYRYLVITGWLRPPRRRERSV